MVFNLTDADWDRAEEYLADKDDGSKFDKYHRNPKTGRKIRKKAVRNHSFVLIEGVIYALSNSQTFSPGIGTAALVKKGLTRAGHEVAIKVEFGELKDENSPQCQIARRHGLLVAQAVREAPNMKITIHDYTTDSTRVLTGDQKRYTVMEWLGDELFGVVLDTWHIAPEITKDLIALRACLCVQALNQAHTLHNDIKAENLTVIFDDEDVTKIQNVAVNAIDTDYALTLPWGETFVTGNDSKGSPGFVAPEILKEHRYSPLSDTYALAVMLLFQLNVARIDTHVDDYTYESLGALKRRPQTILDPLAWLEQRGVQMEPALRKIFADMLAADYKNRSDANGMIRFLCERLKKNPCLPNALKAEIEGIDFNARLQALTTVNSETAPGPSVADAVAAVQGLLFLREASEQAIQPVMQPLMQPLMSEQTLSLQSKESAVAVCK